MLFPNLHLTRKVHLNFLGSPLFSQNIHYVNQINTKKAKIQNYEIYSTAKTRIAKLIRGFASWRLRTQVLYLYIQRKGSKKVFNSPRAVLEARAASSLTSLTFFAKLHFGLRRLRVHTSRAKPSFHETRASGYPEYSSSQSFSHSAPSPHRC